MRSRLRTSRSPSPWVRNAEPPELFEAPARRRHQTDRVGRADRELPRVAALVILHELRRVIGVLLGKMLLPDISRLEDVHVGGDDLVALASHRDPLGGSGAARWH